MRISARKAPLRVLLVIVAGIGILVLAVILWFAMNARLDESRLQTVKSTFAGLSRNEAYARLRRMRLTPMAWDAQNGYLIATDGHTIPWPSRGDVEINFPSAGRTPPQGACGANATAVLVFEKEHVAEISEGRNVLACM